MVRDLYRDLWSAAVLTASILAANVALARGEIAKTPNEETPVPAEEMPAAAAPLADAGAADAIPAVPAREMAAATAPLADAGAVGAIPPAPAGEMAAATTPAAATATPTSVSPEAKSAFDDLSLSQLLDVSVVSSKRSESIADAPSSITVFTAEKIAALGLKTLNDVLQLIPGFDVRRSRQQLQLITVRGVTSDLNERLLIMIDGVRLGSLNDGGTGKTVRAISLMDVERIEIIRGPGSALYGTNAFVAVVSVITKKGSDTGGVHVTAEAGSYAARAADVTAGHKFGDFNLNGHFGYAENRGENFFIAQDGAGVSGNIRDPYKEFVGNLKLGYKDMLQLNVSGAHQVSPQFITVGDVLDPNSTDKATWLVTSLDYYQTFSKALKWQTQLNFAYMDWGPIASLLWPPGLQPSGKFPDGQYAHPHSRDFRYGLDTYVSYQPIHGLNLIAGGAAEYITTNDDDHASNGPDTTGVPATKFYSNPDRYVLAAYAQGDYRFFKGLKLTAGVRHDQYNDFGGTTNPRVALVYNYRDKAWVKGLFATAFRAPTYRELWSSNPAIVGNANAKPETIMTEELVFGVAPWGQLAATVSLFNSDVDDMIYAAQKSPGVLQYNNIGSLVTRGVEAEVKSQVLPGLELAGNYTYVHAENTVLGNTYSAPMVSRHTANFTISRDLFHHLRLSLLGEYRSAKVRATSDIRAPVGEVFLFGAFAKIYDIAEGVAGYVRVSNILNAQYLTPSTYPAKVAGVIPDDIHNRGIEIQVGLTYSFR
jgi:iron complex outermembrane receptor protein